MLPVVMKSTEKISVQKVETKQEEAAPAEGNTEA
jgi:hypothetical protein